MMLNPYLIIVILVGILAAGGGGFKLGSDHEKAAQIDKQELVAEAVDAASAAAAVSIAQLRPIYTTIQGKVQHEIETNTVYRDCKLSSDGLLLANQALNGGSQPAAADGSKLPKTDPAR